MKSLVLFQHPSTKLHIYVLESSSTTEKSQELRIFLNFGKYLEILDQCLSQVLMSKKSRPVLEPSTTLNSPSTTVTQKDVQASPSSPQLSPQFTLYQEKSKVLGLDSGYLRGVGQVNIPSCGTYTTGSFRKNGKSKTIFMGTKFHEKLIFSAFFSRELATNLRS